MRASSERQRGGSAKGSAAGFTLLEVLLAAALAVVLLAGLWSLLSTYERLFSKGQAKVEQAQLVRILFDQLSQDLRSAIPDTATGLPGASSSVRRFGLFGTERSLQVDVLQIAASQLVAASDGREGFAGKPPRSLQVPELHTVQYWLEGPIDPDLSAGAVRQGLVRRELDWEPPAAESGPSPPPAQPLAENADTPGEQGVSLPAPTDPMGTAPFGADLGDPSLLRVPEVAGLEFRYYDGSGWSSQWNSLQRKSLPVAIEIVLRLTGGDGQGQRAAGSPTEEDLMALVLGEKTANELSGPSYRSLVFLPSTGLAHVPKDTASQMFEVLAFPEAPSADWPAPPPAFEPPSPEEPPPLLLVPEDRPDGAGLPLSPGVFPDQWMRRGR